MGSKSPPRIAVVLPSAELGGAEGQALLLAQALANTNSAHIHVFAMGMGERIPALCCAMRLPFTRLPRIESRFAVIEALKSIKAAYIIRRFRPGILIPFTDPANRLCALFRSLIGAQKSIWNQRDAGLHRGAERIERLACERAQRHVANGPEGVAHLLRLGVANAAIRVLPNAVLLQPAQDSCALWRQRLNIPTSAWVVGMVANLHSGKGHHLALSAWHKALPRLQQGDRPPRLVLAGRDDGQLALLQTEAKQLGIADTLVFAGMIDDMAGFLSACDVALSASSAEGCPNAVLEAMTCGLPVVGISIPALRWLLPAVQYRFLANTASTVDLAGVLALCRNDTQVINLCRAANLNRAAGFSLDRMVDGFTSVLGLNRKRPSPCPASHPDLAFLIPTKNRHACLAHSLVTVLVAARTIGAEVIICDQSPTPFPAQSGIRVLHRPDLNGLPAARNALLRATDAEVVCFLDDDTDLAADFALRLQEVVDIEPMICGWGPVMETRPAAVRRLHRLAHLGCLRDARRLLAGRNDDSAQALFGCCFAVRREAAVRTGFDARRAGYALGEDLDFFVRLRAPLRFVRRLFAVHRRDGHDRADAVARGRAKGAFLVWLARRHGRDNPCTLLHLIVALIAAASGRGHEPASWRGVCAGALPPFW